MLTVDELLRKVEAYRRNRLSLKDFEEWFEDNSTESDEAPELRELRIAVDGAFAQYHFDHVGEVAFREELATAVRPHVPIVLQTPEDRIVLSSSTDAEIDVDDPDWHACDRLRPKPQLRSANWVILRPSAAA